MSTSNQRLLLQQLNELHDYLRLLGEHINKIYNRLERIEINIKELNDEQRARIKINKIELENVKKFLVTKFELNDLLEELNKGIKGSFPLLPTLERPTKQLELEEKKEKIEEPREEVRKRRFSFIPRF